MNLADYFEGAQSLGILATADAEGNVDLAIYARPHVMDEATVAFIMGDRLSHRNLQSNPNAAYMFVEHGKGYAGRRLYLTKIREQTDTDLIESIRRKSREDHGSTDSEKYLVRFQVSKVRPLVGD